ncbi:ABC transporter ATP-binding protein [Dictyobacter kobayashii]|uniref:ABC transporter ATP-binding protein n=1 Tax=Dictyobacter kobayashii TaxID=2014872 RepID=A0A402ABP5_9CHLR|nr:ABC transporter ATP-binding protein [Dictyobacter kobayashii]GCE16515.1 ABC transporter ATP-binding protein [Dictyobacter kobayashii]
MSKLEVQNISKQYGNKLAVKDVSFTVDEDELFVLLGPSDSGKTTILRMICGFEQPDNGTILLNEEDITTKESAQRNIAVVFQDYGINPTMSVYDNIAQGLRFRRFPKEEVEMRVQMVAEMLGLREKLARQTRNLSGGELQRVAIGRVMIKDADLYLFDEPISQLDPTTRRRTRQEILMVQRIKKKPGIYITQDHYEAFSMANRIGVISQGRIQQVGTPDELVQTPANLFVARFLCDPPLNTIEGYIQLVGTRYYLRTDSLSFSFPPQWTPLLSRLGPQSKIILGIRPNIIVPEWSINTMGPAPRVMLRAQVIHSGPMMGRRTVLLRASQHTEFMAEFKDNFSIKDGQILTIAINPDQIFFFHPHTEELLNPTAQSVFSLH